MKPNLRKELRKVFEAPTRKEEFLKKLPRTEISNLSFVMAQLGYIPKYVWGIFSFTFGIALVYGCFMEKVTARFSLKSVVLARMGILGISHLLLLMFLIPVCAVHNLATVFQGGLYVLVPYMLTVFIGLWTTRRVHGMESLYICMGIAVGVSGMNFFARSIFPILYEMEYMTIWIIGFIILIILVVREMKKSIEQTEELAWSLS